MASSIIYSIGDSEFMALVLNGTAMIFGGEHSVLEASDFLTMFKIFMAIGTISLVFSAIMKASGGVEYQKVFIGFVLFSILFIPKQDVVIEDVYTGNVRTVANVPWGIAMSGSAISSVGAKITAYMDLAYSPVAPGSQTGSFLEPLQILNAVRRSANQPVLWKAIAKDSLATSAASGGFVDVYTSWYNYIYNCSLFKVDQRIITPDDLQTLPWKDALRLDSAIVFTLIYDKPDLSGGRTLSCKDAWEPLVNITNANGTNVKNALNGILGISDSATDNAITKLNSATNMALGGAITAQEYVITSILEPVLAQAAKGRLSTQLDTNAATMINTALAQRDTQWAAEQTFFMAYMRPMIAFFESIVYALAPIMACIILLGQLGISVALKYFLLNLWVQLFLPLLAIINLYISVKANNALALTGSSLGNNWTSFYALNSASDQMQHWIAMGGGLAAATPFIALALVMGAPAATMTALSSRLAGSDQINEKNLSPDPISTDPVLKANSYVSGDRFSGVSGSGAPPQQISLGQTFSSVRTSLDQEAIKYSNTLGNSIQSSLTNQSTQDGRSAVTSSLSSAVQASGVTDTAWGRSVSQGLQNILGNSAGAKKAINSLIAAQITGGLSTPDGSPLTIAGALRGNSDWSNSSDLSNTISKVADFMKGVNMSDSERAALSRQLASGFDQTKSTGSGISWADQSTSNALGGLSNNAERAQSFSAQDSSAQTLGLMTNLNDNHLLNLLGPNSAVGSNFISQMRSINNPSFQSEARRHSNYAEAHKLFPGDPERAESYGYLRALSSPASFNYQSPDGSDRSSMNLRDQQNAVTALTTALSSSGLGNTSSSLSPSSSSANEGSSNKDLSVTPFSDQRLESPSSPVHRPTVTAPNPNSDVRNFVPSNDAAVNTRHSSDLGELKTTQAAALASFRSGAFAEVRDKFISDYAHGKDISAPFGSYMTKTAADGRSLVFNQGEKTVQSLAHAIKSSISSPAGEVQQISSMSASELQGFKTPDNLVNTPIGKLADFARKSGTSVDGFVESLSKGKPNNLSYPEYNEAVQSSVALLASPAQGQTFSEAYSQKSQAMNAAYLQEKFNEGKSLGLSDDLAAVYQSGFATSWSETFGKVGTWQGIAPVGSAVYEMFTKTSDPGQGESYTNAANNLKRTFAPAGTDADGFLTHPDGSKTQEFTYITNDSGHQQIQLTDERNEQYSNAILSKVIEASSASSTSNAILMDVNRAELLRDNPTDSSGGKNK